MRKRILFALPAMGIGGSERVMLNLLRNIDTERFEPHLTLLEPGGMRIEDMPAYVDVHELGIRRARWAALPIAKLCWKLKPDVVFSMSAYLNSVIVASRSLLPNGTTLFVREGSDITSPQVTPSRFKSLVYKQAYKRADLVICQSEFMKQDLVRQFGLAPWKVVRIYNPVDIAAIVALADAEPNPFGEAGPNLVAVGRFSREKGFDVLLKSLQLVRVAVPNVSTTIVGDGPDLPALKAVQHQFGLDSAVRFVGPRRNPFPFLKHANLLVLPSRSEAMPNVVLEAIALGTPAITTNCTGALREVSSCTRRLRVARDRTPETLAAEVISALTDANAKRERGVEPQFEAQFGARAVVQQYERVLLQNIEARSAHATRRAAA
jgi:glycosyltransferase involved in cell wall biosynthesis